MADETIAQQEDQDFEAAFNEDDDSQPADGAPAQTAAETPGESGDEFEQGEESPPAEPGTEGQAEADKTPEKQEPTEVEELKRKAHGYDSMLGRLEAERRQRKALEERLAALEKGNAAQPVEQAVTAKVVEVPDEIKADIETLKERDPQLAALALEDSKEGKKIRAALEEYGVDYAEERADAIRLRRDLESKLASIETRTSGVAEATAVNTFYSTVATKHSDWVELATEPTKSDEFHAYMGKVRTWAESKPYSEGRRLFEIMEKGTPAEVIGLLDSYKKDTSQPVKAAHPSAADAMAVPSKSGPPPSKKLAPKDDFDAAFNEAPD